MKKFLVVVGLMVSQLGMATSLVPSILEYRQTPASAESKVALKSLTVYANGSAVAAVKTEQGSKIVSVQQLDVDAIDEIYEQIKDARFGKVTKQFPGVACFMASPYLHNYTAERGRIIIYKGHPCNGPLTVNTSRAARELHQTMSELISKAFKAPADL